MSRPGLAVLIALAGASLCHATPPIQQVTGNGRICVALDDAGGLVQWYWPGAGGGQLLGGDGARWRLAGADGAVTFNDGTWIVEQDYAAPDSLVLKTRYREESGARSAEQIVAVVPERDLMVVRLLLRGFAPDTRAFWVQSVTPAGPPAPGLAAMQPLLGALSGFATGYDGPAQLLEHVRPADAGQKAWARGRVWVERGGEIDWDRGVCVGTVSPQGVVAASALADLAAWDGDLPLPDIHRSLGASSGILACVPNPTREGLEFVVFLGASDTRKGLRALLSEGLSQGRESLEIGANGLGARWLAEVPSAPANALRSWLNLRLATAGDTGALLHAPAQVTSATYCDVIDSAWASAALDGIGASRRAQDVLAPHVNSLRVESTPEAPAGSLSRRIYPNGAPAFADGNADPEGAAWLLAACWRHAVSLPVAEQAPYLASIWPALERSTDYLAREPRVGGALSGALSAGSAPLDTLRTHYLGLESSRRMATLLGKAEPGLWSDRRSEVYSRIRFRKLNQGDGSGPGSPWIDWWIALLPSAVPEVAAGWEVLKSGIAPELSEASLGEYAKEEDLGFSAPLARRDALRCLLALAGSG